MLHVWFLMQHLSWWDPKFILCVCAHMDDSAGFSWGEEAWFVGRWWKQQEVGCASTGFWVADKGKGDRKEQAAAKGYRGLERRGE